MQNERKWCVYKHTSPSGKVYIGITSTNPEKRWNSGNGYRQNPYFFSAIKKYGWTNIEHDILFTELTLEEANEKEIELIKTYNSTDLKYGYNISPGGSLFSDETREKLRQAQLGEKNPNYGKPKSEKWKKDASERHTKHWQTHKHPCLGVSRSEETRKRISEAKKGKPSPLKGKPRPLEFLEGSIKARIKPVRCIETGIVYESASQIQKVLGFDSRNISRACNHPDKHKIAYGYHWEFAEKEVA